ncbi:MAG: AbrB/MazE/SpoVT family DNA-binding domain-containing protein [Pyramidobacter sp.]|nr:AbrB/MazE/SpoVT family DNA-binding domain-containing protein [Pyramidobacter sp.]MBQ8129395.1 AbrB/MazE/SpoVT family DNA-binding domain-containing protein [Clostridia bacterium]
MPTALCAWGNSRAVRIPKNVLDSLEWKGDEEVEITAEGEMIVIRKAKPRETLAGLFEGYAGGYKPEEIDWGKPEGREVW